MRVAVLEGHDFSAWRDEHESGVRPSELPYGLEHLQRLGVELRHSDLTHADDPVGRLLRSRDSSLPYVLRYRGALGQVVTSLPLLALSDVCVSIFEHHADVYRRLSARMQHVLPPLVLVSCYLAQWLRAGAPPLRRRAVAIARDSAAITVFSANQVSILTDAAGVPPERISVIPYGIDTAFYSPSTSVSPPPPSYVLAVGKDDGRDWSTFLDAAGRTPEIPYRFATAPSMVHGKDIPENVDFLGEVDHPTYRELLRESELVVLPTHDFAYPTGQSVYLEAMACGRPAVVTNTPAIRDYLTPATRTCALADPADLARQVSESWRDRLGRGRLETEVRRIAQQRFSTENLWAAALPAITGAARGGRADHQIG